MNNFNMANVDISEVTETYERKPNRLIPVFIYCMALLVLVMAALGSFLKVESATTAIGIVAPREEKAAVTAGVDGIVARVCCNEGQYIHAGETILMLDSTEYDTRMDELNKKISDCMREQRMLDMFLEGIRAGRNPFNPDISGEEYKYYIQYCLFELDLHDESSTIVNESASDPSVVSPVILKKISGILAQRDMISEQAEKIETELAQTEAFASECVIRAEQDGVITMMPELREGMKLQAGMDVAAIALDTGNKVAVYVQNTDILKIHVGDEVKYHISSSGDGSQLWIGGRIEGISSEAIGLDEGNMAGYFVADGSLDEEYITNGQNDRRLLPGMQVEVKIVTETISLLRYLMRKINLG